MAKVKVRITRTWDAEVEAEYGDNEASLIAKAQAKGEPDSEIRTVLRTPEQEASLLSAQEGISQDVALKQVTKTGGTK